MTCGQKVIISVLIALLCITNVEPVYCGHTRDHLVCPLNLEVILCRSLCTMYNNNNIVWTKNSDLINKEVSFNREVIHVTYVFFIH